jgi:hypothetical protein
MLKSIVIIVAGLVMAAPAAAQTAPADPATSSAPAAQKLKDPNRIICEREEEIGSRLGGKKTCKTAQEWQEWRQQNRDQVETWQRQLTTPGKPAG